MLDRSYLILLFKQHEQIDYDVCILLFSTIICASTLFMFCYFGKLATESYEQMAHCLYKCNWHTFSVTQRKYIVTMIQNAQSPAFYHTMRVAILNLETFFKVRHKLTKMHDNISIKLTL